MRRLYVVGLPLLAACVIALSGCSGGRELTPEEKAGNPNFMGNNPSEAPLSNAPGTQSGTTQVNPPGPKTGGN